MQPIAEILDRYGIKPGSTLEHAAKMIFCLVIEKQTLPEDVSAEYYIQDRQKIARFNPVKTPQRQRYAIAHALGHAAYNHKTRHECGTHQLFGATKCPTEEAANEFALELLIPTHTVKNTIAVTKDFKEFAKFYDVPEKAAYNKLVKLGILKPLQPAIKSVSL